jgi:hypothetical protein
MAMGPSGARCEAWACRLVAGSKLLLLLLTLAESPGGFSSWEYKDENETWIVIEEKKPSQWFEAKVSELRSIARRRLVETKNPSACATLNCKLAISYSTVLIVIKKDSVTEVLINPIIRSRTRHFLMHTTLHVKLCIFTCMSDYICDLDGWLDLLTTYTITTNDYSIQTTDPYRVVSSV